MTVDLEHLIPIKTVEKVWGRELWLINNNKYCAKILELKPGYECSLHYHKIKDETFTILRGCVHIETRATMGKATATHIMTPGETLRIFPYTAHRFKANECSDVVILEISTTHSDEDVVRLEESRKIDEYNTPDSKQNII